MNKNLLYKYFNNKATEQEIDQIISWVEESPKNLNFFAEQKAIWDISGKKENYKKGTVAKRNNRKFIKFAYFAAASIVAILLTIDIFIHFNTPTDTPNFTKDISSITPKEMLRTVYTEKGVKAKIMLPDSSLVWLNSDSKISYPVVFEGNTRNIELSGEALFDVKRDSLCPMIIKTNKDFYIEVFGTCFNVKSYENDDISQTTLYSGLIAMHYRDYKDRSDKMIKLKPDDSFTFYTKGNLPIINKIPKNDKSKAWVNGELFFEQTPMEEVIKMLERWHGTNFIIKDSSFFNNKLTASFQSESIIQIMEIMKYCIDIDYQIIDNTVIIK